MHPHELVVDTYGRVACRQTQDAVAAFARPLAYKIRDLPGDGFAGLCRMRVDAHRNALALSQWIGHRFSWRSSAAAFSGRGRFDTSAHLNQHQIVNVNNVPRSSREPVAALPVWRIPNLYYRSPQLYANAP